MTLSLPLVSVIIATNNEAGYIREAIQSVRDQTFTAWELLVANYARQDEIREFIQEFQSTGLTYIFEQNQGLGHALNTLVKLARAKYICVFGAKDISCPERLERQYNYLVETGQKAVFAGDDSKPLPSLFVYPDMPNGVTQAELFNRLFFNGFNDNLLPLECGMIERQILLETGLFSNTFTKLAPQDLWFKLLKKYPLPVLPEKLVVRRESEVFNNSIISATNSTQVMYEAVQIRREVFNDISIELFKEAFAGKLRRPDCQEGPEFELEKAFLFFHHLLPSVRSLGLEKLTYLLQDPATLEVSKSYYRFGLPEFFTLFASMNLSDIAEKTIIIEWAENLRVEYLNTREGFKNLEKEYKKLSQSYTEIQAEYLKLNEWAGSLQSKYITVEDWARSLEGEYIKLQEKAARLEEEVEIMAWADIRSPGHEDASDPDLWEVKTRVSQKMEAYRQLELTLARFEKDLRQLQATRTVRLAGYIQKAWGKIAGSKFNPFKPAGNYGKESR